MQISGQMFLFIKLLFAAAVAVGFGCVIYLIFVASENIDTELLEAQKDFTQYQGAAGVFRGRTGSYDGACSGMLLPDRVTCSDNDLSYVIETRLSDGSYYCGDSTGFQGQQREAHRGDSCS